jgi:hypothetical protein
MNSWTSVESPAFGWQIGLAIGGAALLVIVAWGLVGALRERDAFRYASDPQLPVAVRLRAIARLSGRSRLFSSQWGREHIPRLLADLRSYDRHPSVREAAAGALQRSFRETTQQYLV